MRDSNYFYGYTVVTANYMRESGKRDPKILIQLPRKNGWHLISDGTHKISHVFTPFTRFNEVTRFSHMSVQKLLVRNPFQRDSLCLYSTDHYKYWSPEQEPDPTENFVGALSQKIDKPNFYHNIYHKYDENEDMDEETFLRTIKYYPCTYFSDSSQEDENSSKNGGILRQNSDGRNSVGSHSGKITTKNSATVDPTCAKNILNVRNREPFSSSITVRTKNQKIFRSKTFTNRRKWYI